MTRIAVVLCALCLLGYVQAKDDIDRLVDTVEGFIYGIDSKVVELNDDTFKKEMVNFPTAFVEFVAPWCTHCKRLTPDFERAAKICQKNNIPVTYVKVNCDGPGYHTCHDAKADIYPTLKLFRSGVEERRYYGERTPKDLVRYTLNMIGPHVKDLNTKDELAAFEVSDEEYMFVGAFEADSPLKTEFLDLAAEMREFNRYGVLGTDLMKEIGQTNAVLAYQPAMLRNKYEPSVKVFTGDARDLRNFIKQVKVDLVGIIKKKHAQSFEVARPLLITTFDINFDVNKKHTNYVRNRLLKLATEFEGKMSFCMGDLNMTRYYAPDDRYNDTGIVMTVISKEGWEYTVPKDVQFTLPNVRKVVEDVLSGEIVAKPFMSEDPPVQKKRVKRVVANTFHDIVLDESKHTLIEFYSPYCSHCKQLIPVYNDLASRARTDPSIVIAKMDATANTVPKPFESRGFPTICLVTKGRSVAPIKFEGDRTVEQFIAFMKANTKDELVFIDPEEKKEAGESKESAEGGAGGDAGTCSASPDAGTCGAEPKNEL